MTTMEGMQVAGILPSYLLVPIWHLFTTCAM